MYWVLDVTLACMLTMDSQNATHVIVTQGDLPVNLVKMANVHVTMLKLLEKNVIVVLKITLIFQIAQLVNVLWKVAWIQIAIKRLVIVIVKQISLVEDVINVWITSLDIQIAQVDKFQC